MEQDVKQGRQGTDEELKGVDPAKATKGKDPDEAEVSGQELWFVRCWNCGTINGVYSWEDYFICRRCGTISWK
jgi:hypothetical protein